MTSNQLQIIKDRINSYLSSYRINPALEELDSLAAATNASWNIREKIASIKENYNLMGKYALDGINDSSRTQVRNDIISGITATTDIILREAKLQDSPKLYFSALRYERLQGDTTIASLIELYKEKNNRMAMGLMTGNTDIKEPDGRNLSEVLDNIAARIFNKVWTTHPFTQSDTHALSMFMKDATISKNIKLQLIGAVMLGGMEYFSENRLLMLGEIYNGNMPELEIHALCALLLTMWMQREHIHTSKIKSMIATLSELPAWQADVKMAFLQFIRTRDTERINRTMREDVIPSMMKIRPDINKIVKDDPDILDPMSLEDNPEWEELFEKSGLGSKLRELSEMQAEGADVMMSTFAHLKSFPYFNEVAHWFQPFFPEQHHVSKALGGNSIELAEMLESTPMLCDSDKYSMAFSLEQVAGAARKVMLEQIKAQNINMAELKNSSLLPDANSRENIANKYVQDLYRFFSLYRRKNEFANPFASPVNLVEIPEIAAAFDADDTLQLVAQFYFKRKYFNEAYTIYSMMLEHGASDAQTLQKAGYCMQQLCDIARATELYERSELLNPDNQWTQRRLAICYRSLGQYDKASKYYEKLLKLNPDDLSLSLHLGNCYLDLKRYDDALKQYFKVEFMDSESKRALRPLAWCLLITGQSQRSRSYYEKIIADAPTSNDYLNYGHLEMAQGNFRDAITRYRESIKLSGNDYEKWKELFNADRNELITLNVDPFIIDLVADNI